MCLDCHNPNYVPCTAIHSRMFPGSLTWLLARLHFAIAQTQNNSNACSLNVTIWCLMIMFHANLSPRKNCKRVGRCCTIYYDVMLTTSSNDNQKVQKTAQGEGRQNRVTSILVIARVKIPWCWAMFTPHCIHQDYGFIVIVQTPTSPNDELPWARSPCCWLKPHNWWVHEYVSKLKRHTPISGYPASLLNMMAQQSSLIYHGWWTWPIQTTYINIHTGMNILQQQANLMVLTSGHYITFRPKGLVWPRTAENWGQNCSRSKL